jgi:hypothetical protein
VRARRDELAFITSVSRLITAPSSGIEPKTPNIFKLLVLRFKNYRAAEKILQQVNFTSVCDPLNQALHA